MTSDSPTATFAGTRSSRIAGCVGAAWKARRAVSLGSTYAGADRGGSAGKRCPLSGTSRSCALLVNVWCSSAKVRDPSMMGMFCVWTASTLSFSALSVQPALEDIPSRAYVARLLFGNAHRQISWMI
eukprot:1982745-Pleurochrysis_carterae.AAC.2